MTSSQITTAGNVLVVTHVHPFSDQGVNNININNNNHGNNQKFNRVSPLALGTAQIMIGVMVLSFGIASSLYGPSLSIFSGIFVWGALLYISAGSLAVAAGKSTSRCLINGTMAVNIIAAVASLSGFILYILDIFAWYYESSFQGASAVLAIFQFLEFIVSIIVASTACYATCNCCAEPDTVVLHPAASMAAPALQTIYYPKTHEEDSFAGMPPAYNPPI